MNDKKFMADNYGDLQDRATYMTEPVPADNSTRMKEAVENFCTFTSQHFTDRERAVILQALRIRFADMRDRVLHETECKFKELAAHITELKDLEF